jgi:5'-3' exonuclease
MDANKDIALFIDLRNAMYRAVYAIKSMQYRRVQRDSHSITVLLRQIVSWIRELKPTSVHAFYDAPRSTVWRREVSDVYKDRTKSGYVEDISKDLEICTIISKEIFSNLNVRQYYKNRMEADDLIFAASSVRHPKRTIIISTDSDMLQIPYMFNSCSVYDPKLAAIVEVPMVHPAISKSIIGDKSDNIKGYHGIGPKKGKLITEDASKLAEFLEYKGKDTFQKNMLLTDLMLNPKLMSNKFYVLNSMASEIKYDKDEIRSLIKKYKITGLLNDFVELIYPFEKLR